MKKWLLLAALLFTAGLLLKGKVNVTRDQQLRVGSWTFPIPEPVRNSSFMVLINSLAGGSEPAAPAVLPTIIRGTNTSEPDRPNAGSPPGSR